MKIILAIGAGSFIGGIFRYLLSILVKNKLVIDFPAGTLLVNITGCFLIGFLFAIASKINLTPEWKLFLGTGIIGGFTTFSAFSLETVTLFQTGNYFSAITYVLVSMLLGILATFSGIMILKLL